MGGLIFDCYSDNINLINYEVLSIPTTKTFLGYGNYNGLSYTKTYSATTYSNINAIQVAETSAGADKESSQVIYTSATNGYVYYLKYIENGATVFDAITQGAPAQGRPTKISSVGQSWSPGGSSTNTVESLSGSGYSYSDLLKVKWQEGTDVDYEYYKLGVGEIADHWFGSDYPNGNGWKLQ